MYEIAASFWTTCLFSLVKWDRPTESVVVVVSNRIPACQGEKKNCRGEKSHLVFVMVTSLDSANIRGDQFFRKRKTFVRLQLFMHRK